MRHAVGDLLRHFLQGTKLDPQSLLWGVLIGACILSALHLITMFVTRWGDRRVTGKALLFSLMLHFGCLVGVVTVVPAPSLPPGDPDGGEQSHRVVIRSVTAQAEHDFGADVGGAGQTPVWDRIANPGQMKPLGPQPKLPAPAAAPSVGRVAQSPKPVELPAPDLATLPDVQPPPTATPLQESAATPKKSTQTPDIEAPKSAPLSTPSADTVPRPAARSTAPTAAASVERQTPATTDLPSVPDESMHPEPSSLPDLPVPAPKANVASIPATDPLRRDAAPAPVPTPQMETETSVAQSAKPATGGSPSAAGSITPQQPGALSGMVVDRVPSGALSGSTTPQPEPTRSRGLSVARRSSVAQHPRLRSRVGAVDRQTQRGHRANLSPAKTLQSQGKRPAVRRHRPV